MIVVALLSFMGKLRQKLSHQSQEFYVHSAAYTYRSTLGYQSRFFFLPYTHRRRRG